VSPVVATAQDSVRAGAVDGFDLACPRCGGSLLVHGPDAMRCPADGLVFARREGVWDFLPPDRAAHFARFVADYEAVRHGEGRGLADPEFYRALPYRDLSGRFADDWRIRARSFDALVARVVAPLERDRDRPLRVLDLGAGNGWLSGRLAGRGHHVAAVDLLVNPEDGLGAHVHSVATFLPVRAEIDRLPFAAGRVDLVVYNGALHYSTSYPATLAEALRVLAPDGVLAIVDSPIYRDGESGRQMLRERAEQFCRAYGFASDALPSEGYLTWARLDSLGRDLGVEWTVFRPWYGWRWALRPWKARLRRSREPAAFAVVAGRRAGAAVTRSRRERVLTPLVRARYLLMRRRYGRLALERLDDLSLIVLPGVFNPVLMRSGAAFARLLDDRLVPPGSRVLDLGAGSGVVAIRALRWAASAVATDINPAAVRCARINALLNDVESRLDLREGDLFAPVAGERFDRVLFNPPFFRGEPRDPLDRAWRSTDVPGRFASGLRDHLAPGGAALLLLSTHGDERLFLDPLRGAGFDIDVAARARLTNETLTIYRVTPERSEPC